MAAPTYKTTVYKRIQCEHPVTGEILTFYARDVQTINERRSHHPIVVFDNGTYDEEDWFYRVVDKYNDRLVGRYDRPHDEYWELYKKRVVEIKLVSFEDWKKKSTRISETENEKFTTFNLNPNQTFEDFVAMMDQNEKRMNDMHLSFEKPRE